MATKFLRKLSVARTSQPQSAAQLNPVILGSKCVAAWNPGFGTYIPTAINPTNLSSPAISGISTTFSKYVCWTNSTGSINAGQDNASIVSGAVSFLAIFRTTSTASYCALMSCVIGGDHGWEFRTGGSSQIQVVSNNTQLANSGVVNDGQWHIALGSISESASAVWVDGIKFLGSGTGAGHAISGLGTNPWVLLSRSDTTNPFQGDVALLSIFDGFHSDAQAAALSANPWQLFAYSPRQLTIPNPPTKKLRRTLTRTQQPQGAVGLANPFRSATSLAVIPGLGEVSQQAALTFGASPGVGPSGRTLVFGGATSNRVAYQYAVPSGDLTLVARFTTTTTAIQFQTVVGVFDISTGSAIAHYISLENSQLCAISTDAGNWSLAVGPFYSAGVEYTCVATFRAGGGRSLWINGVLAATDSTARSPASVSAFITGAYVGAGVYQSPLNGAVSISAALPYAVPDAVAQSISANPWQLFAPSTIKYAAITTAQMRQITRRVTYTRQPPGPTVVDRSNPITHGLLETVIPVTGYTAKGSPGVLGGDGSLLENTVRSLGPVKRITATTNSANGMISFSGMWTVDPPYTVHTLFFVDSIPGSGGAAECVGGCWFNNSFGWKFDVSSDTGVLTATVVWGGGGVGASASTSGSIPLGVPVLATIVAKIGTFDLYINGVPAVTGVAHSATGLNVPTPMYPFLDQTGVRFSVPSGVYNISHWNRALAAEEVASLANNPWQLFKPNSREIQVPLLVGTITSSSRFSGDEVVTGWTYTGPSLATSIGEYPYDDNTYATSPPVSTSPFFISLLTTPLPSGTYAIKIRSRIRSGPGPVNATVYLLDASNTVVGTSSAVSISSGTVQEFQTSQFTTTGTATKVKVALT